MGHRAAIYCRVSTADQSCERQEFDLRAFAGRAGYDVVGIFGTVAKLAMRQPFVLFKGLTFQKLCLPGAFRPGDHHNKMLRPGLCVVHASPQYL
ncbi:recombinase family protein [Klebsiella pneumoniae]